MARSVPGRRPEFPRPVRDALTLCALGLLAGPALAQSTARFEFRGTGSVGASMSMQVTGVPFGVAGVLGVFGSRPGTFEVPPFGTLSPCFEGSPDTLGDVLLVPMTVRLRSAGTAFALPNDPFLVGTPLIGNVLWFEPVTGVPRTSNCASFVVATDVAASTALVSTFDQPRPGGGAAPRLAVADEGEPFSGIAVPRPIGGDGRLGRFDVTAGTPVQGAPSPTYVFDTDDQRFDAAVTRSGRAERVTDGVFHFLDFHVPAGTVVRFVGSKPARIFVAGDAWIEGTLDLSGASLEPAAGTAGVLLGQEGGEAGAGGGAGGAGGDVPDPAAVRGPDGEPGASIPVPPGLGLSSDAFDATVGGASPANPAGGDPALVAYGFLGFLSNQIAGGGGGGAGILGAGADAAVLAARGGQLGAVGASGRGGVAGATTWPPARGVDLRGAVVGGAGGGGSGIHPYDSVNGSPVVWVPGSGGGGGGGALMLVVAGDLRVDAAGAVVVSGGSAAVRTSTTDGLLRAPGGGGGGGSMLMQVAGSFENLGTLRALGGDGGSSVDDRPAPGTSLVGGDGGDGWIRIEVRGGAPDPSAVGDALPAPALGPLTSTTVDLRTAVAGPWQRLPAGADPARASYELYGLVGGLVGAWSDRPGFGAGPTRDGSDPFVLFTRRAMLDAAGEPVAGTATRWTVGVDRTVPATEDGVQWLVVFDRSLLGPSTPLRLETVRLLF